MNRTILICLAVALVACTPKPQADSARKNAFELLQGDSFWTLAFGDSTAGSMSLSFIDSDGNILHVWAQAPTPKRQFFLKRTYNDPKAVEVLPGSPVEKRVLELLGTYQRRSHISIPDSYAQHFVRMLQDRQQPFPDYNEWTTPPK